MAARTEHVGIKECPTLALEQIILNLTAYLASTINDTIDGKDIRKPGHDGRAPISEKFHISSGLLEVFEQELESRPASELTILKRFV
jgi:hypothetical protein